MKGLIWNCKKIKWRVAGKEKRVTDCLLIFICFEMGDGKDKLAMAIRRISQLNKKRYRKRNIVIFPFAHLSRNILNESDAGKMFKLFIIKIKEAFKLVEQIPFKTEKECFFHLSPKRKDASFFEY